MGPPASSTRSRKVSSDVPIATESPTRPKRSRTQSNSKVGSATTTDKSTKEPTNLSVEDAGDNSDMTLPASEKQVNGKIVENNTETETDHQKRKSVLSSFSSSKRRVRCDSNSSDSSGTESIPCLTSRRVSPTSSNIGDHEDESSSIDDKRKCTMVVDTKSYSVYYPNSGSSGQTLAMNGIPTIEGHTSDGGYVIKFEEGAAKKAMIQNNKKKFRMKCFTSQFGDSKVLVKRIMTAHQNSNGKWLYLKDLDCGDKRANIGLLLHEMCVKYSVLKEEDKYEIASAAHLGFNNGIFAVSQTVQLDLKEMTFLSLEDCILIEDSNPGTIEFRMDESVTMDQSSSAMKEINEKCMEYFDERQLLVFRSAILYAFVSPHLRDMQLLTSLPVVCCYGPNNCGKTIRMNAYSSACGVRGGKNKKSTEKGALEIMGENSLTFIPFDDPPKKVFEQICEHGFDGSDVTKVKGNVIVSLKMLRNVFGTSKVAAFDQNYHSKLIFTPELPIERERLVSKRDLAMTVERITAQLGPKAVLHNLQFANLFAEQLIPDYTKYVNDTERILPEAVGEFSRWNESHALLLLSIKLVLDVEPEWTVTYEEVLDYLKGAYSKMVSTLKCYGSKMKTTQGAPSADITGLVEKITAFLSTQNQVKEWIRLSTTVGTAKPVLALRSTIFERAEVPSFPYDLRASNYFVEQRANTRFLSPESPVPYFKLGANPVGKCFATSALLVDSEVDVFKPLIELLKDQEMKDGRTADGRQIEAAKENEDGEVCSKCMKVGKDLLLCSNCNRTVYCSAVCQRRDWRHHSLVCKRKDKKKATADTNGEK